MISRSSRVITQIVLKRFLRLLKEKKEIDEFYKQIKTIPLKKIGFYANIDDVNGISAKYINKSHVERLQSQEN